MLLIHDLVQYDKETVLHLLPVHLAIFNKHSYKILFKNNCSIMINRFKEQTIIGIKILKWHNQEHKVFFSQLLKNKKIKYYNQKKYQIFLIIA